MSEIEILLKRLGISDDLVQGKFKCAFCVEVITLENFDGMFFEKVDDSDIFDSDEAGKVVDMLLERVVGIGPEHDVYLVSS
jgi:hypothetical protein